MQANKPQGIKQHKMQQSKSGPKTQKMQEANTQNVKSAAGKTSKRHKCSKHKGKMDKHAAGALAKNTEMQQA